MRLMLVHSEYKFNDQASIWMRKDYAGINYCDGDEVEKRIASIIENSIDLAVLSDELRLHCTDWPSLYHLSGTRANILRPFEPDLRGDILEIGAGCGAITRYLGECGGNVLALEGSPRRAAIARARTHDLDNVSVVSDKFDDFRCDKKFDVVTLIGVLEYANLFTSGENPTLSMLERSRSFLKPNGKMIVAIENQLGLKYFAGALEDHVGISMYGIEGRYRNDQPQTFGRKELFCLLKRAGFSSIECLAPFPDYKLPVSIVTERGFLCDAFDAAAFAWQSVRRDPQLPSIMAFSPELAWTSIINNELALDLANSFLIVASPAKSESLVPSTTLAWHFTTERRKEFCKIAEFVLLQATKVEVRYKRPVPNVPNSVEGSLLRHYLPERTEYKKGILLSYKLMRVVTRDGWRTEDICVLLHDWVSVIAKLVVDQGRQTNISSQFSELPGDLFDYIPQNFIISDDGVFHVIDTEWSINQRLEAGYVVFRAFWSLINSVSKFGVPADCENTSYIGFLHSVMARLGWSLSNDDVDRYLTLEAKISAEVTGRIVDPKEAMAWLRTGVLPRNNLIQALTERDGQVTRLSQSLAERDGQIDSLLGSKSWRVTRPLRWAGALIRKTGKLFSMFPLIIRFGGGIVPTFYKALRILRRDGFMGVKLRVRRFFDAPFHDGVLASTQQAVRSSDEFSLATFPIVPYYMPLGLSEEDAPERQIAIAIHLHLHYAEMIDQFISYLNNIPYGYDLYVSIPQISDANTVQESLKQSLVRAGKVIVEPVPNRGRDIAPMIVQFGKRLAQYEIISHIHAENEPRLREMAGWCQGIMALLFGAPGSRGGYVGHIIELLQGTAKIVFPESPVQLVRDQSGWRANRALARQFLEKYTKISIDEFPVVEFPVGSMLWGRTECLKELLELPLTYEDFPAESIAVDGTLSHVLEQLFLVFASNHPGQCIRLHVGDSIQDYRHYEEQCDFSDALAHTDIKVLSYYLPQFHPIPENDEWHGKGFTEWTNVRATNPLFQGHYQQHIPHADIGYYQLDSSDTLRRQADQMRKAGVYGQVFYHYWFTGKLILEEPAQLLLANSDIEMPFCFCWANENWTRRWDGNEKEILLSQNYCSQDAAEFIRYLVPFFKDRRYIKIERRPVLFVYRPSSIPNSMEYLDIWEQECAKAGIGRPYVVAVLTRGATDPRNFGMDAGAERVLHDWTQGAVPEIKGTLNSYRPMSGSVLSYEDVAAYYMGQREVKNFTYFRSLVPTWDNTARYGAQAYLLHGSTPQRFQTWLERLIEYTRATLPPDRRFVLVNAWNEWAEGAHLEPDSRYGYSYLNSVGRVLSGIAYGADALSEKPLPSGFRIHMTFLEPLLDQLRLDTALCQRFVDSLSRSSIFDLCQVSTDATELAGVSALAGKIVDADSVHDSYILQFRKVAMFGPRLIEKMAKLACASPNSVVLSNAYDRRAEIIETAENGSVMSYVAHESPLTLLPVAFSGIDIKNYKVRTDAHSFVTYVESHEDKGLPEVTTIIRFHRAGSLDALGNALYSLAAMERCIVTPLIAAQDLSEQQKILLDNLLGQVPWVQGVRPQIHHYSSSGGISDLRSKMLNESLRQVETRYAGFLDYDDLLMSHAYSWLIARLRLTRKAVSFGRVYRTVYDSSTGRYLRRDRTFEFGKSYEDFLYNNFIPLHSVMIDLEKIVTDNIKYFEDHQFMEDYFLFLQIITSENADWEGLAQNIYIGDYIYSADRLHTLAITDEKHRVKLLNSPKYRQCQNRIDEMRIAIRAKSVKKLH